MMIFARCLSSRASLSTQRATSLQKVSRIAVQKRKNVTPANARDDDDIEFGEELVKQLMNGGGGLGAGG
jgi:hypothetical protein